MNPARATEMRRRLATVIALCKLAIDGIVECDPMAEVLERLEGADEELLKTKALARRAHVEEVSNGG